MINRVTNDYYSHFVVFTLVAAAHPFPVRSNANEDKVNECQGSDKISGENSAILQLGRVLQNSLNVFLYSAE